MHLSTRNVNTAFTELVKFFDDGAKNRTETFFRGINPIVRRTSRNGPVLMIDEPVTITYEKPLERVLFNPARDANPFALLYESLWMLAGRNDVVPLVYYTRRMTDYSDDGKTLNGAYGYRWRQALRNDNFDPMMGHIGPSEYKIDQLDILVTHLKADPTSRRAVLQMWNVEDDLLKIGGTELVRDWKNDWGSYPTMSAYKPNTGSKDVCCNLSVIFSVRHMDDGTMTFKERRENPLVPIPGTEKIGRDCLDMTVFNRSNDLVWGLLGANYVTFSVLQEYMSARLGVVVGRYHHVTNNLHVYTETNSGFKPNEWLAAEEHLNRHTSDYGERDELGSPNGPMKTLPLVRDPETFEKELPAFVETWANPDNVEDPLRKWDEPFLQTVAGPMLTAFQSHKRNAATTFEWANRIAADDWRIAATNWLQRRAK